MSYNYAVEQPWVFTDVGQRQLLRILSFAQRMLDEAGAVQADKLLSAAGVGDTWKMLACIDRLVEVGELREVTDASKCAGQHRVFVSGRNESWP